MRGTHRLSSSVSSRGFSLIEVTIALAIVTFALTSLLGLMPTGLSIFREAIEANVRADIIRKLAGEFQRTPFDELGTSTAMRYFTDQGLEVDNEEDALLGVRYTVTASTPLLEGSTQASYRNSFLKSVRIEIFTRQDRARTPAAASFSTVIFVPHMGA